ncbi:MAG: hypothetical protein H0U70_10960 [Tatlockia sp.]|nr:hypothetical protein [Tatlockia sp.]
MSEVLQRLESVIGDSLSYDEKNNLTWKLGKELNNKGDEFFHPWVTEHPNLNALYNLTCMQLSHLLAQKKSTIEQFDEEEAEAITKLLLRALDIAELLIHIYCRFLPVNREVERLKEEQEVYRTLLRMREIQFPETNKNYKTEPSFFIFRYLEFCKVMSALFQKVQLPQVILDYVNEIDFSTALKNFSQKVRATTAEYNIFRLLVVRARRFFTTLVPVLAHVKKYVQFIAVIDPFISPIVNYLAWIFYLPRLFVNLFLLLKHVLPNRWMTDEEKKLSWQIRLQAQLQRRWFELLNDSLWFIGGLLGCFVFVGSLGFVGMYLTIALFFKDMVSSSVRAYIELGRLNNLRAEYVQSAKDLDKSGLTDAKGMVEIQEYQRNLDKTLCYEKKRLILSVISTTCLFLAMLLAIPAIPIPMITFIGAVIVLIITILTYLGNKWVETQKPLIKVNDIADKGKLRFFKPAVLPGSTEVKNTGQHSQVNVNTINEDFEQDESQQENLGIL